MGRTQVDAGRGHDAFDAGGTQEESCQGLLGMEQWVGWRQVMKMQYGRSFEDLENFARNPSDPHLRAWKDFNRRVRSNGSVDVWHETFKVNAG